VTFTLSEFLGKNNFSTMKKTNDLPIGDVLKQMVKAFRMEDNLNRVKIENYWEQEMGEAIAKHTRDLRLRNKILYITIDSAPLRQELHIGREKIKKILNEAIGEEYISDVVVQ
jgi:predicted nucleic acid-binding Zn ribbon protein